MTWTQGRQAESTLALRDIYFGLLKDLQSKGKMMGKVSSHVEVWGSHSGMYICCLYICCSSVTKSCPTLCEPMDYSTPGFPVLHCLLEFAQTHVHWVSNAIQPSHPLSSPSPPAFNLSQHQGLVQWVSSLYQVAKALELPLQHQSFQWIFKISFL